MKRRIAAVVVIAGALGVMAAPSFAATTPSLCIDGNITVNGTTQVIHQCLPPS